MVGAAESTVSPSSSSTRRSTPCVLGCCGPMLTVIVSERRSDIGIGQRAGKGQRQRAEGKSTKKGKSTNKSRNAGNGRADSHGHGQAPGRAVSCALRLSSSLCPL